MKAWMAWVLYWSLQWQKSNDYSSHVKGELVETEGDCKPDQPGQEA